jgi:isoleucyl-tRNA synthetase
VSRALEALRVRGDIGSSLDADVELYCDAGPLAILSAFGDELRFVFITSSVRLAESEQRPADAAACGIDGLWLAVRASPHSKCVRCWHHRPDVGHDKQHPELCARCVDNVAGGGERRVHA